MDFARSGSMKLAATLFRNSSQPTSEIVVTRDTHVIAVVGVLYIALILGAVPAEEHLRLISSTAVLVALAWIAARAWRTQYTPPSSILVVSFIAAGVLVMPGFGAMGGNNGPALPVGFVGTLLVAMWWVTLRWVATPKQPRQPLRQPIMFALLGALCLSLIASVPILIMLVADPSRGERLLLVYPAYFGGAILAAVTYWLLQAIAHRPIGKYLIAGAAGTCLYAAVGPVVFLIDGEPIIVSELLGMGAVCGFLVGPPVAFSWSANATADKRRKKRPKTPRRRTDVQQ